MTSKQYLIGTCLGCKKCLYCGSELSIRKKSCLCDKTVKPSKDNRTAQVKVAFSRILKPNLSPKQLEFIQESVIRFGYSLDLNTAFKFSFCSACNSAFQRKKHIPTTPTSTSTLDRSSSEPANDFDEPDDKYELDTDEKLEELSISFNLTVKPSTGPALPSKWVEIEASSLDDILADIHYYIGKLTGNEEIMHSDYLVSFKPEKAVGAGTQLVDLQDYKKFLLDYKRLVDKKKNMMIVVLLKEKKKKKQKIMIIYLLIINSLCKFM